MCCFFSLAIENEEIIRQLEGTEDFLRTQQNMHANINVRQQATREDKRNPARVTSPNTQDTTAFPEDKMLSSRVKGKVKNFIKIFNQEGAPKRKGTFEMPVRGPRGKDEVKVKVEDPVMTPTAKIDAQVKTNSTVGNSVLSYAPVPVSDLILILSKVLVSLTITRTTAIYWYIIY